VVVSSTEFDQIGYWSEIKLDIVREYAVAYSNILAAQKGLSHAYIDGFSGRGVHVSKSTGECRGEDRLGDLLEIHESAGLR